MGNQISARKWRPKKFSGPVGQDQASRGLINRLDHARLHHAFLFTGTRGIGKVTDARVLGRALNGKNRAIKQPRKR